MKQKIKMMAIVRKYYDIEIDENDENSKANAITIKEEDFMKQTVGEVAFHYFPTEEEDK